MKDALFDGSGLTYEGVVVFCRLKVNRVRPILEKQTFVDFVPRVAVNRKIPVKIHSSANSAT